MENYCVCSCGYLSEPLEQCLFFEQKPVFSLSEDLVGLFPVPFQQLGIKSEPRHPKYLFHMKDSDMRNALTPYLFSRIAQCVPHASADVIKVDVVILAGNVRLMELGVSSLDGYWKALRDYFNSMNSVFERGGHVWKAVKLKIQDYEFNMTTDNEEEMIDPAGKLIFTFNKIGIAELANAKSL